MGRSGNLTYTLKNPEISSLEKLAARAFGKVLMEKDPEIDCSVSLIMFFEDDNPDVYLPSEMQYLISDQIDQIMNEEEEDDFEPKKSIDFSQSLHELQTRNDTFNSHRNWSPSDFVGESRQISPFDTISHGERRFEGRYGFSVHDFFKEFWGWNPYWIESCTIHSTWVNEM